MASFDIGARVRNSVDSKKIQDVVQRMKTRILVGYPSGRIHVEDARLEKGNSEQIETSELAKQLFYGTATIPARPFLEDAIRENKDEIAETLKSEAQKEFNGGQANWSKVGSMVVGKVQELVRSDYYKNSIPNSPKTIALKGSDKPLINTADLINSTTFIVDKGGKE